MAVEHYKELSQSVPESNGILLHAVYGKPMNNGVDECNIWGDCYYFEALKAFKGLEIILVIKGGYQ